MESPTTTAASQGEGAKRAVVAVSYEHSTSLPALLEQLGLSILLSTYQAGRVVSVGSHRVSCARLLPL
jgi:hypothetical protein